MLLFFIAREKFAQGLFFLLYCASVRILTVWFLIFPADYLEQADSGPSESTSELPFGQQRERKSQRCPQNTRSSRFDCLLFKHKASKTALCLYSRESPGCKHKSENVTLTQRAFTQSPLTSDLLWWYRQACAKEQNASNLELNKLFVKKKTIK